MHFDAAVKKLIEACQSINESLLKNCNKEHHMSNKLTGYTPLPNPLTGLKPLGDRQKMLNPIISAIDIEPPYLKALHEQQNDLLNLGIYHEPPILKAFRAQQEKPGHIINAEPLFIKALREQQERLGHPIVNTELTVLKVLREQEEILDRITSIQAAYFLRVLNQQQDMLSYHPIFLSLEDIRNKSLTPKEQAYEITYEIAHFLDSEEKQKLEESLSAHSLTSWLSAVLLVYYMVREITISSSDIDTSSQQLIQDNIDNIQSLVSRIQSSTMLHFLISLRRNHRLGELLAQ